MPTPASVMPRPVPPARAYAALLLALAAVIAAGGAWYAVAGRGAGAPAGSQTGWLATTDAHISIRLAYAAGPDCAQPCDSISLWLRYRFPRSRVAPPPRWYRVANSRCVDVRTGEAVDSICARISAIGGRDWRGAPYVLLKLAPGGAQLERLQADEAPELRIADVPFSLTADSRAAMRKWLARVAPAPRGAPEAAGS